MLTCKEVSQRASDLIDGELDLWETWQMRMHLALCKGCGRFVDQLRVTRDMSMATPKTSVFDAGDQNDIDAILSKVNGSN